MNTELSTLFTLFRFSCGIELDDKFVVTWGYEPDDKINISRTVAVFTETGNVTYLPKMMKERYYHACAKFVNNKGNTVSLVRDAMTWSSYLFY